MKTKRVEREKLARWLVNTSHKYRDYTEEVLLQEWEDTKDKGSAVHKLTETDAIGLFIPFYVYSEENLTSALPST